MFRLTRSSIFHRSFAVGFLLLGMTSLGAAFDVAFRPCMQQDDRGNRIVIWIAQQGEQTAIQATTLPAGAAPLPPTTISSSTRTVVSIPVLSVNKAGMAAVVWESLDCALGTHGIEIATCLPGREWSAPMLISDGYEDVKTGDHQLTLDEWGNVVVVWSTHLADSPLPFQIRSMTGCIGGSWDSPITISQ